MCRIPYRSFSQYEEDTIFCISGRTLLDCSGAQPDFTTLTHHWNFDEGRDWHNMPFPYANGPSTAMDSVGDNPITIANPASAWASGRQFSGAPFHQRDAAADSAT